MANTIGKQLQEARLQRGLSLEEVSHQTRIPEAHLLHLEDGDFAAFGSAAYARGFLRKYSEFLGLDPEEAVDAMGAVPGPLAGKSRPGLSIDLTPSDTVIPIVKHQVETVTQRSLMVPLLVLAFLLAIPTVYLVGKRVAFQEAGEMRSEAGPVVLEPETPATQLEEAEEEAVPEPVRAVPRSQARYSPEPPEPPQPSPELDALIGLGTPAGQDENEER